MAHKLFPADFYEVQLVILAGLCVAALLVERYVSQSHKRNQTKDSAEDQLESGKVGNAGAMSLLTKKYLLVYAIVMGTSINLASDACLA